MTHAEYASIRRQLGTQEHVSEILDIDFRTLQRREQGKTRISFEAEIAMKFVLSQKKPNEKSYSSYSIATR